jgi:hypothetical protein
MPTAETLATIASLVTAAGVTMLFFRIARELAVRERAPDAWIVRQVPGTEPPVWKAQGETKQLVSWLAFADWLVIGATLLAIVAVLLPLLIVTDSDLVGKRIPAAGCAASLVALAGYIPSLLAHYRIVIGARRTSERENPEPGEAIGVAITTTASVASFVASLVSTG